MRSRISCRFMTWAGRRTSGTRVVLAARLFDRRIIEILEETGQLNLPQWRVVAQLGLIGTGTVRSLADGAAVDRAEVSRAIQELMKRGFIERTENAADKRSPTFALTEAGHGRLHRRAQADRQIHPASRGRPGPQGSRGSGQGALGDHEELPEAGVSFAARSMRHFALPTRGLEQLKRGHHHDRQHQCAGRLARRRA